MAAAFHICAADPHGELIAELNRLRTDPATYAASLESRRQYYKGNLLSLPNRIPLQTNEGVRALDEAVRVLKACKPLPRITESQPLANAAANHVRDIGPKGLVSHEGSNRSLPATRIRKYAASMGATAEVISFGPKQPREVISGLLIDDGVPTRGHRAILLDPRFRLAGAACGPHATFGTVCVIDFVDRLIEK